MIDGLKVIVNRYQKEDAILFVSPDYFVRLRQLEELNIDDFDLEQRKSRLAKQLAIVAQLRDVRKEKSG